MRPSWKSATSPATNSSTRSFDKVRERYGRIDTLVHSVAYANREDLGRRFVDISRAGFSMALDISAYSLIAMAKREPRR